MLSSDPGGGGRRWCTGKCIVKRDFGDILRTTERCEIIQSFQENGFQGVQEQKGAHLGS
jgi:hypothetical protein